MELTEEKRLEIIAYEAFIRRAAEVNMPFMLKGSYATRQYFPPDMPRIPNDLDWVYLNFIEDVEDAKKIFNDWANAVTKCQMFDGVEFRPFSENAFWRMIDYAMADDFPTVNTDLVCWVDRKEVDLFIDISFNLDIDNPPVPLLFKPARGSSFEVPLTVPISNQVAWKIHQAFVRPRFKDLLDLTYLVQHTSFTKEELNSALKVLMKECKRDEVDPQLIRKFLEMDIAHLFVLSDIKNPWPRWRHGFPQSHGYYYYDPSAKYLTNETLLPETFAGFLENFKTILQRAGFVPELADKLGLPKRQPGLSFGDNKTNEVSDKLPAEPLDPLKNKSDEELMAVKPRNYLTGETPTSAKTLLTTRPEPGATKSLWSYIRNFFKA